jgi:iron-sulfur cluster repair protein YtfE (RIC family)
MKRHSSLVSLSRDHHQALILAQLIKKGAPPYKGLPTALQEKAIFAANFYRNELDKHFNQEEEILIKLISGIDKMLDQLANEIKEEHKELRRSFQDIGTAPDLATHLDTLGKKLEQHIRKEERVFFPMVQQHCNEKTLNDIETFLSQ